MSRKNKVLKILLPLLILTLGVLIMISLTTSRKAPEKAAKKDLGALVQVQSAVTAEHQVIVTGTGTVQAAMEITLVPQVSGRVAYMNPSLVTGGFLRKGDTLFEIEDTDYRLALERAEAARAKAEYDLQVVEGSALVARAEWERMIGDKGAPPNPLVFQEPQLKNARAALVSAKATIGQAKLELERTRIKAPFNAVVRSKALDLGQYVRSGNVVAVLAGTDKAEIMAPLPLEERQWLDIPAPGNRNAGSSAEIILEQGDRSFLWPGRIIRSLGEIDAKSRMMQIIVEVTDPYGLLPKKGRGEQTSPPLAIGSFVTARFKGKVLPRATAIPASAFRDGSTVWIMDQEQTLRIRKVSPARMDQGKVIVKEGLKEGDLVILTNISGAAEGMKLRVATVKTP